MDGIINLKNTSFCAQNKTVVSEISFSFLKGKTYALVGPSGCGKSTLLKLAAGLIIPSSGEVYFYDTAITNMSRKQNFEFRKETSFVFQDSALWANQNIRQILELPLLIHAPEMTQRQRTERIVQVLAEVGYKKEIDIRPAQLSMGEQKMIAFSRAMVSSPSILFLDEWTESLDDAAARRLINIVKKKQKEELTIIFVSHNFSIIQQLAQEICLIIDGRLSLQVSAEEFAANESLSKIIEKGINS